MTLSTEEIFNLPRIVEEGALTLEKFRRAKAAFQEAIQEAERRQQERRDREGYWVCETYRAMPRTKKRRIRNKWRKRDLRFRVRFIPPKY